MIPSCNDYRLLDYCFNDVALDDDDTLKASIRMFMELDLLEKFRIDYEVSKRGLTTRPVCLIFTICSLHLMRLMLIKYTLCLHMVGLQQYWRNV